MTSTETLPDLAHGRQITTVPLDSLHPRRCPRPTAPRVLTKSCRQTACQPQGKAPPNVHPQAARAIEGSIATHLGRRPGHFQAWRALRKEVDHQWIATSHQLRQQPESPTRPMRGLEFATVVWSSRRALRGSPSRTTGVPSNVSSSA